MIFLKDNAGAVWIFLWSLLLSSSRREIIKDKCIAFNPFTKRSMREWADFGPKKEIPNRAPLLRDGWSLLSSTWVVIWGERRCDCTVGITHLHQGWLSCIPRTTVSPALGQRRLRGFNWDLQVLFTTNVALAFSALLISGLMSWQH